MDNLKRRIHELEQEMKMTQAQKDISEMLKENNKYVTILVITVVGIATTIIISMLKN